jgi:D-alanyl-D-alanine-carboxypeptidase/D-alanyl-D-alanine-endopeptidase
MHWALPLLSATMCLSAWGVTFAQSSPAARDAGQLAEAALGELPGAVSVGVLRAGKIQVAVRRRERPGEPMEKVDGPVPGAEPIFEIGSVSKVFTGLLVAQRVEGGELRLDDTIGHLLQGAVAFRYETASTISVRQLVTHTSCLQRWPAGFTAERMFDPSTEFGPARLRATLTDLVVARTPPCETRYSNVGYAILGEVLAQRSQRPWDSLVLEGIAQPLALRDTRVHLSPAQQARLAPPWNGARRSQGWTSGAFASAGGLHSTATDLLVFSQALLQGRGGPFGASAERLVTDLAAFGENGARIGYGILMPKAPARTWGHDGETRAYSTEWVLWPDTKEAVVILASNKAAPTRTIRRELVAQTWSGPIQEVVYTRGEFRGTFEEDGGRRLYARVKLAPGLKLPFSTLTFRVRDPKLVVGIASGAAVEFRAEPVDGETTITALRIQP